MRLTNDHLRYWQAKKAQPRWARHIPAPPGAFADQAGPKVGPSIHALVNQHAGIPTTRQVQHYAASNLLAILRMMRKRNADLCQELERIAATPGRLIDAERRRAFAHKWARRIALQRAKVVSGY